MSENIPKLSKNSDQYIELLLRKRNGSTIDPFTVHLKGAIYTEKDKPFEFEANKGIGTNCKIESGVIKLHVVPNLNPGTVWFQGWRFTTPEDIKGKYIYQALNLEIAGNAVNIQDLQDSATADLLLYGDETDPRTTYVAPGDVKSVQEVVTQYLNSVLPTGVNDEVVKVLPGLISKAGLLNQDLSNLDPNTLLENAEKAGLAKDDLSNVILLALNKLIEQSAAYKKLANIDHPDTKGRTNSEIINLFHTNRYEEADAVDLNSDPYNKSTTLLMAYKVQDGKAIQQTLPPIADNRIIMVQIIEKPGITGASVVINPALGEMIDGSTSPITLTGDGLKAVFIPLQNENTWEMISYDVLSKNALSGQDDYGTIVQVINDIYFKKPLKLKWNNDTKQVELSVEGDLSMSFVDTILQKNFKAALGQSMDGSILIRPILIGKDDDGKDLYKVDFSIAKTAAQEGVARVAEYIQLINLSYPDNQPIFNNVLYPGGSSVHINNQSDGIVVQEIDGKDPNLTGGTLFLAVLDYSPDSSQDNTLTQDGTIRLALTDSGGNYLKTLNDGNAVIERAYKSGDEIQPMRLAVLFRATTYKEVFYRIEGSFAQEEAISVGLGSGMFIQAVESDSGMGNAMMAYEVYTGSHVEIGKINYSTNNINFARTLTKDGPSQIGGDNTSNLGNNLFLDIRTSMSTQIINDSLKIEATNPPCVLSLYKIYNEVDLRRLTGKNIAISVKLKNKDSAARVVMLGYKGTDPIPSPKLLSFNNGKPQYNTGWSEIDSLFMSEEALSEEHQETKVFSFPSVEDGYKSCAFLLRPEDGSVPVNMTIFDFEGDIKPGFVFAVVKEQYSPGQMSLISKDLFTKSTILCPIEYSAYRYTIGTDDTKIPVGTFKDNIFVKNNNAWYDAGSVGKSDQGDIEILKSFQGSLSYSLNIFNEQATDSNVTVWMAKVESDGSFTKIPESELIVPVAAKTEPSVVNLVTKPSFDYHFKKGESYRWFAKADKADGAYIQCNNGSHVPMAEIILDVKYYTEIPEDVLDINNIVKVKLVKQGKEISSKGYSIEIDVDTNTLKVVPIVPVTPVVPIV